eukprot:2508623-Amphidinium_carterae.1
MVTGWSSWVKVEVSLIVKLGQAAMAIPTQAKPPSCPACQRAKHKPSVFGVHMPFLQRCVMYTHILSIGMFFFMLSYEG